MIRRVMLLGSSLEIGGAERVIANLARHLDPDRFAVTVGHMFGGRGSIGDELARDGIDVVAVPRDPRPGFRYLTSVGLGRVIRERNIDLVHSHTHYALTDSALYVLASRRRVKLVHTFHFGNYPHLPARYRLLEAFGSRVADCLVSVGIEQAKAVRATFRLEAQRVQVVMNGGNLASVPVDREWEERLRRRGALVVGTVCTFIEQKGLPDLLKVAAVLKGAGANVVFVVVGDGHLRSEMEARRHAMDLDEYVWFTGAKPHAAASMMPLFDIVYQPSLWEAMSMVVVEAMATGKPVVATDVGDNRHLVVTGETGHVVPRGDVPAMAAALQTLVESPRLRAEYGRLARRRYEAHYTVQSMIERYERLYSDVLSVP